MRTRAVAERGVLKTVVGDRIVRATRVSPGPADGVLPALDEYLTETELMILQRRLPLGGRYVRDASVRPGLTRINRTFTKSHRALDSSLLAGVLGSGTAIATAWAIVVGATTLADPLMLLGIPLVGSSWIGMRAIYANLSSQALLKLEALLDLVECDEL